MAGWGSPKAHSPGDGGPSIPGNPPKYSPWRRGPHSTYGNPQNGTKGCHSYTPLGRRLVGCRDPPWVRSPPRAPHWGVEQGTPGVPGSPWHLWGSLPSPPILLPPRQLRTVTGNEFLLQSDQEATIQEWVRAIRGVIRRLVSAGEGVGVAPWLPPAPLVSPNVHPPPPRTWRTLWTRLWGGCTRGTPGTWWSSAGRRTRHRGSLRGPGLQVGLGG